MQLFSEYAAWVRTRAVETRDYWTMRGWWMPGFAWLDDARYPRHKAEQMKLLEMITEYAKAEPGTVELNERAYARYKRYSFDFDQKNFKLDFTNGVLIYKSIKGARANPTGHRLHGAESERHHLGRQHRGARRNRARRLDEARRDRRLCSGTKPILDYLVQGRHEVERKVEPFWQRRQPDDDARASAEGREEGRRQDRRRREQVRPVPH